MRGRSQEGRPTLASAVGEHEAQIRIHTESHRNVLRHFASHRHVLVRGAAGTGKTILALEAAVQYVSLGQRVLLTCWNVMLGHWMRASLHDKLATIGSPLADNVTDAPDGRIVVTDVGALARHGTAAAPGDDLHGWFHEQLPDALTPAVTDGEFDVVVLDEAQDLSELWILAVSSLVSRDGRWFAFSPTISRRCSAPMLRSPTSSTSSTSCAGTSATRAPSAPSRPGTGIWSSTASPARNRRSGSCRYPPNTSSHASQVARKLQRDERISDADLAVLWLFHNPSRGETDRLAASALAGERIETNAAAFRGMERPVVVFGVDADVSRSERIEEARRSLYVAATRARSLLVVVGSPETCDTIGLNDLAAELAASR